MSDLRFTAGDLSAEELADYLRLYLDETGEQLDGLVETLLVLEASPGNIAGLNEAFRLIHSIKGSSALLGLDKITTLTHHLESHFERLRTGQRVLDPATMAVVLRCIDFLRACNDHLRHGRPLGPAGDLLEEVKSLEAGDQNAPAAAEPPAPTAGPAPEEPRATAAEPSPSLTACWRLGVALRPGLPLAAMKVELILARLVEKADLIDLEPPRDALSSRTEIGGFEAILRSGSDRDAILALARVEGVEAIDLEQVGSEVRISRGATPELSPGATPELSPGATPAGSGGESKSAGPESSRADAPPAQGGPPLAETVRVDVERLDILLNLVGELVVSRARLTQLAGELAPTFGKSGLASRLTGTVEALRDLLRQVAPAGELPARTVGELPAKTVGELPARTVGELPAKTVGELPAKTVGELPAKAEAGVPSRPAGNAFGMIAAQLEQLEQQTRLWESGRLAFAELAGAIDELSRVSSSLQRGVLNTRMVPVGPLFNRFKRSVRDIARELGKQVRLEISGEKTELDKRMIDEIGDPLNHLIRNCIDHGIEPADLRQRRGKPEVATVRLSASHRGNNVFITVEDDGGGIDTRRVRQIAVDRGIVSAEQATTLGERELVELIFRPGFSTAARVSDISGRGVGMDIVRTRIGALNGTIEVESAAEQGTRFTIRLPLTLTITRCMLFGLAQGVVAIPVENVREITAAARHPRMVVEGREVCDLRGEFLPVVGIDEIFAWPASPEHGAAGPPPNIAVLHANNRVLGLRVDTLLGGQDLVVKPLDENFIHVRGLGGASILGDGSVCMLLDVAACLDLVRRGHEPAGPVDSDLRPGTREHLT